jgi:putative DNA primase/helicase
VVSADDHETNVTRLFNGTTRVPTDGPADRTGARLASARCESLKPGLPTECEEALAQSFADAHADDLRYVAMWDRWMLWDGGRWVEDEILQSFGLIRRFCAATARSMHNPRDAVRIGSAKTVAAIRTLIRADPRIAATVAQWDADAWLLNTPSGPIDLRTGQMRPPSRADCCTKSTAVAPGGACPIWLSFLARIFADDHELIAFVQRVAGYCLTGSTKEHALLFGYGTGGNGKGVLINTLVKILGTYARVAPIETFTATIGDRHPTELAMLRGARLVTAQETEDGQRWPESKIKALTGGDPVSARFMRQDFFTYTPQFKLFIAGNHKPSLRGVDEAIRRRFHLIPFKVTIPEDERDPDLPQKLREEWPGILAWAVEGCLDWQRIGLKPPDAVKEATAKYLEAEDAFTLWMDECVDVGPGKWANSTDLFTSWKLWCERAGEQAGGKKRFVQTIEARGFLPERKEHGRGFIGLSLHHDRSEEPYWAP